ncbi:MAG: DUF1461 domain-containing protein [Nanobdellota archaeon]
MKIKIDLKKMQKRMHKISSYFISSSTIILSLLISFFISFSISGFFVSDKNIHSKVISFLAGNNNALKGFTEREIIHMYDVKALIVVLMIIFFILATQTIISLIMLNKKIETSKSIFIKSFKHLKNIKWIFISIIIIIIMFFKQSFILFHKIIFNNNYWILPSDSMLIKAYPETFFLKMTILFFIISLIIIEIFKVYYKYLSVKDKLKKIQNQRDKKNGK